MTRATLRPTRRHRSSVRRRLLQVLVAVLGAALVATTSIEPAQAWDPTSPDPCFLNASGELECDSLEPAPLLSTVDLEAMRPETAASMKVLERQAIQNTLDDHQLPDSDWNAAATWARSDAQAELFALVVQAIETPDGARTADQQNVARWVGRILQNRAIEAASFAGEEYARFAGFKVDAFRTLLIDDASESELRDFLDEPIQPYDAGGYERATGGYCRYHPPSPYQDQYDGHTLQTCYTPCSTIYCTVNVPKYDQFVTWGQARSTAGFGTGTEYFAHASAVALGASFASAPLAGAAAAAAWPALLGLISGGEALFMSLTGTVWAVDLATGAALEGAELLSIGLEFATEAEVALAAVAAEATAIGGAVATVIAAIVMIVLEGIKVFDEEALPGKLASLIAGARSTPVDARAVLEGPQGLAAIYEIFIGATLPAPSVPRCDRYVKPAPYEPQCLNAPAIPPAAGDDPHFLVTAPDGTTRESTTIALDSLDGVTRTVRTDGRWFVQRRALEGQVVWSRDLGLTYTDWEGHPRHAWLTGDGTDGYAFRDVEVGADDVACVADGSCGTIRRIRYLGADGKKYAATVEPYHAPVGAPRVLTRSPYEGTPVSFTAGGFAPPSPVGSVTYRWRFQRAGCSLSCLDFDGTASGAEVSHTWKGDGTFDVELTATDASGRQVATTFPVVVAGIAPRLTLYPACSSTTTSSCNVEDGTESRPMVLWGSVAHTFADENEQVTVDWGDGTSDSSGEGPDGLHTGDEADQSLHFGSTTATTFMVMATHTYTAAGTYHGTMTVRDGTGHVVTESFTEHVAAAEPPA